MSLLDCSNCGERTADSDGAVCPGCSETHDKAFMDQADAAKRQYLEADGQYHECLIERDQLKADFNRRTDILNNHIAREKVLEEENSRLLLASRYNSDIADQALSAMKDANARVKTLEDVLEVIASGNCSPGALFVAKQALAAKEPRIARHTKAPHLGNGALTRDLWWCECGRGLGENINLFDIHKRFGYCPCCGSEVDWKSVGLGDTEHSNRGNGGEAKP